MENFAFDMTNVHCGNCQAKVKTIASTQLEDVNMDMDSMVLQGTPKASFNMDLLVLDMQRAGFGASLRSN